MRLSARAVFAMIVLSVVLAASGARASETDQYYGREIELRDASAVIEARVNKAIHKAVEEWQGPRDDFEFAKKVRWAVDGTLAFNRISFWADGNPQIDRLHTPMSKSIYAKLMPWESALPLLQHLATTIAVRLHDGGMARFGSDKLTHMLSVGWIYTTKFHQTGTEDASIRYGWKTEMQVLGYGSNGVFSNGDLTANYEGMRFYRGLTEDGIVQGKPAIVKWQGDTPVIQRRFEIADHASPYWDESINTSYLRPAVSRKVDRKILDYCPGYRARPDLYDIDPAVEEQLDARYARLMLRDNKAHRVSAVCAAAGE